jgi:hypothetical protein
MNKRRYKRHRDDEWFDEIRLETEAGAVLQIITVPRYKTSGLSGDEWRTSARIQIARGDGHWEDYDRGFQNLSAATKGLYPGFYTSHPEFHDTPVASIDFYRKGHKVYESTYDGQPLPLLHAAGHLPWAFVLASEAGTYSRDLEEPYCFQPGCPNEAISTFRLKYEYCSEGYKMEPRRETCRRFCRAHLVRGDCGLEDADDNYIVIEGPGPDEAEGWEEFEKPSVFGGVLDLT